MLLKLNSVQGADARRRRALTTATSVAAMLAAGCMSERIYDEGPNHPPNTVFLDQAPYTTPPPDTLITDASVTMYFFGTDQADGDAISHYYYRVTPPDTGWIQIRGDVGHVTLPELRDTTYTFCIYAEDVRGGVDPDPPCRRFFVDVFHLGEISLTAEFIERTGEVEFAWEMVGSEEPPLAFDWETQMVQYDIADTGLRTPLVVGPRLPGPPTNTLRVMPDPSRRYCLSVFAQDNEGREPAPKRLCYP